MRKDRWASIRRRSRRREAVGKYFLGRNKSLMLSNVQSKP